jgi:protein gp37
MAENSAIEWTDHTFNPWEGCQKVGPGCDHCYAETRNARFGGGTAPNWGPGAPRRRTSAANWRKPIRWNSDAPTFYAAHGRHQRVFCASLADVFDNAVDPQWRADLFSVIERTPNLMWLLLTKRIGNVIDMVPDTWRGGFPGNVWQGITVVNQAEFDRDLARLWSLPARVRFLSIEPMLGLINMRGIRFEQVICGGESGPGARPMHPDWARSLRDQCAAADVPFLFKQWGEWIEVDNFDGSTGTIEVDNGSDDADAQWSLAKRPALIAQNGRVYDRDSLPEELPCRLIDRVGKKAAGRLLDGVTHDGFPA